MGKKDEGGNCCSGRICIVMNTRAEAEAMSPRGSAEAEF